MAEASETRRGAHDAGLDGIDQLRLFREGDWSRRRPLRCQPQEPRLTLTASAAIANAELGGTDTSLAIITFVAVGSITVVGAVVVYLAAPTKAERPLTAIRQFMADNNATIMMVILVLLGVKILGDALAGVWS